MTAVARVERAHAVRATCAPRQRARAIGPALASLVAFGLYSVYLGQDSNWDQRNYHVYNTYAFLRGRLDYDLLASGIHTFKPTFYDLPFYYISRRWPPVLAGFSLGALQGVNAILAFLLARALLPATSPHRAVLAATAAGVGVWSPAAMSELGTSFGDNIVSLFVLGSLLSLVTSDDAMARTSRAVLAGTLSGIAAGLKYTNAIYSVALITAVAGLGIRRRVPRSTVVGLVGGLTIGALLADGVWAWRLWRLFGNPVFPFFNGIFRSPYWMEMNFSDVRWIPRGIGDGLAYPFHFVRSQSRTMEIPFRDLRWAVLVLLALGCAGRRLARRLRPRLHDPTLSAGASPRSTLLVAFGTVAFLLWVFAFGYHRYLVPLELVSGVLLVVGCFDLCSGERARLVLVVSLSLLIVGTMETSSWGRVPWGNTWYGVRIRGYVPPDSMVLMTQSEPMSYVAPFFSRRVRFVKLEVFGRAQGFGPALAHDVTAAVAAHTGPLRVLVKGGVAANDRSVLGKYGLEATDRCVPIESRFDRDLALCTVRRVRDQR